MKNFIQPGNVVDVIATAAVASGAPVLIGSLFGVATKAAAIGEVVPIVVEGVVEINKDTALAVLQGDRLFWDAANAWVDKTSAAQTCVGVAVEGAIAAATKIKMKIGAYTPAGL